MIGTRAWYLYSKHIMSAAEKKESEYIVMKTVALYLYISTRLLPCPYGRYEDWKQGQQLACLGETLFASPLVAWQPL